MTKKLLTIAVFPILVFGCVGAIAVVQTMTFADRAHDQAARMEQVLAMERLSSAVRVELAIIQDPGETQENITTARSATDALWVEVFGILDEDDRARLDQHQIELLRIREVLGDEPPFVGEPSAGAAADELMSAIGSDRLALAAAVDETAAKNVVNTDTFLRNGMLVGTGSLVAVALMTILLTRSATREVRWLELNRREPLSGFVPPATSHGALPFEADDDDQIASMAGAKVINADPAAAAGKPDPVVADGALSETVSGASKPVPESLRPPVHRGRAADAMPLLPTAIPVSAEVQRFVPEASPAIPEVVPAEENLSELGEAQKPTGVQEPEIIEPPDDVEESDDVEEPDDFSILARLHRRSAAAPTHREIDAPTERVTADQFAVAFAAASIDPAASIDSAGNIDSTVLPESVTFAPLHHALYGSPAPLPHQSLSDVVESELTTISPPSIPPSPSHTLPNADTPAEVEGIDESFAPATTDPPTPSESADGHDANSTSEPEDDFAEPVHPDSATQLQLIALDPVQIPDTSPNPTQEDVLSTKEHREPAIALQPGAERAPTDVEILSNQLDQRLDEKWTTVPAILTIEAAFAAFERRPKPYDQAAYPDDDELELLSSDDG
ncbi:MAG: hypothetical protein HKN03_15940 [Acidimicrobiales bacterium]|nr:hypothetical protein [Acidimicrobiales bacterium]